MTQSESSQWNKSEKKQKNFECPCGKSYLSYPALYTHIKQTHNGNAPGEIKRPDSHNRGRPKVSGLSKLQQHNKSIQYQLNNDPIPQLLKILQQSTSLLKNRQIQQIYQNQPVYRLIMNDKAKDFKPKFIKDDCVYHVKMGQGIVQFFNEIQSKITNKHLYDQVVLLIVLLTQHIIQQTEDQNVLSLGTIGLMPEFINYFIIHDFQKPIERLKLKDEWIFQNQNSMRIFDVFFKWMIFKQFTLTKVIINTKFLSFDQQSQQIQSSEIQNQNMNGNVNESKDLVDHNPFQFNADENENNFEDQPSQSQINQNDNEVQQNLQARIGKKHVKQVQYQQVQQILYD